MMNNRNVLLVGVATLIAVTVFLVLRSQGGPAAVPPTTAGSELPPPAPVVEFEATPAPPVPPAGGVDAAEGMPGFGDIPVTHRPAAILAARDRLAQWLDAHDGNALSLEVGAPDCAAVPCIVPVEAPAGSMEEMTAQQGAIGEGGRAAMRDEPIVVMEHLEGGGQRVWLYWTHPGADDEDRHLMQLAANQRVFDRQ
jgi:hypothetical protein